MAQFPARNVAAALALVLLAVAGCTDEVAGHAAPVTPNRTALTSGGPVDTPAPSGPACAGARFSPARITLPSASPQRLPLTTDSPVALSDLVEQFQRLGATDAREELTRDGFTGGWSRLWKSGKQGTSSYRVDAVDYYTFSDGAAACRFVAWYAALRELGPVTAAGIPGAVGLLDDSDQSHTSEEYLVSTGRHAILANSASGAGGFGRKLLSAAYTQR